MILEVRILKELEGDFSEVRILKDLASLDRTIGGSGVGARVGAATGTGAGFRVRGGIVVGVVGGWIINAGD
jgi:hypothetical protein